MKINKKNKEFIKQNRNKVFNILLNFFMFFKDNGGKNIGISIDDFVEKYLKEIEK